MPGSKRQKGKIMAKRKKYSAAEKKSYKRGFFAGLFVSKKKKKTSSKKIHIPKTATESQRHNILMRDDPDYVAALRAARRSAADIKDTEKYEVAVKQFRDKYYSEIKKGSDYGKYLKNKFGD